MKPVFDVMKFGIVTIFIMAMNCCESRIRNLAKNPMTRTIVIENNLDYFYRNFKPSTPREEVLRLLPPMNSDSETIAVWVDPLDGEVEADITGKPWRELVKGRDGYYICFDEGGKVIGYIASISGSPPDESL